MTLQCTKILHDLFYLMSSDGVSIVITLQVEHLTSLIKCKTSKNVVKAPEDCSIISD